MKTLIPVALTFFFTSLVFGVLCTWVGKEREQIGYREGFKAGQSKGAFETAQSCKTEYYHNMLDFIKEFDSLKAAQPNATISQLTIFEKQKDWLRANRYTPAVAFCIDGLANSVPEKRTGKIMPGRSYSQWANVRCNCYPRHRNNPAHLHFKH